MIRPFPILSPFMLSALVILIPASVSASTSVAPGRDLGKSWWANSPEDTVSRQRRFVTG
jgi:hypothetical protein